VHRQLRFERDLRRQIAEHYAQVQETRRALDLTPDNVQAVVETALALAGQPSLLSAEDSSRQDAKAQRGLEYESTKASEATKHCNSNRSLTALAAGNRQRGFFAR
jgi:hypothetical protein